MGRRKEKEWNRHTSIIQENGVVVKDMKVTFLFLLYELDLCNISAAGFLSHEIQEKMG